MTEIVLSSSPGINYFPSNVLKWMKKNANPWMSVKLMQTCKYFQHQKFPFHYINDFSIYHNDELYSFFNRKFSNGEFKNLSNNLWLTGTLLAYHQTNKIPALIEKTIVCDIRHIKFMNQQITFKEFKFFTENGYIEDVYMAYTRITLESGDLVGLEDIFECLPNAESLMIHSNVPTFRSQKRWNNLEIKFTHISLYIILEDFDIDEFSHFMIKNQETKFVLYFHHNLPSDYTSKIHKCMEQIEQKWDFSQNQLPDFSGIIKQKKSKFVGIKKKKMLP